MRRFASAVILVFALGMGACSSAEETTTTADASPTSVVGSGVADARDANIRLVEFLGMLREGRYEDTATLVDEPQLLLLTAIEVGDASMLTDVVSGSAELSAQVRRNFWASFVAAIPGLAGDADLDLRFATPFTYSAGGDEFTAIDVTVGDNEAAGMWVLRNHPQRGWIIDPIASFGGPFVGPYTQWTGTLSADQRDVAVNAADFYRSSWEALGDRQPLDEPGVAIGQALTELFVVLDGS